MEKLNFGYVEYHPYDQRVIDRQYPNLMINIMDHGKVVRPIQGGEAKMIVGAQFHYLMANGFPIDTLRDLSGNMLMGTLAEETGFLNGAETLEELKSFGMPEVFWKRWVTAEKCAVFGLEPGHLGSASYGPMWTKMPTRDGGTFNQIRALEEGIKERPHLRTWRITPWYPPEIFGPQGTRKVVVAPCHGDVHVITDPLTKELTIHHYQRSGDLPVGAVLNIIQYAAFGLMLAKLIGYKFVELVQTFSDVHIYDVQYDIVNEMLTQEVSRPFPSLILNSNALRMEDYRAQNFELNEYVSGKKRIIPTPT